MTKLRLLGALDPVMAWDGARLYRAGDLGPQTGTPWNLRGAAASVEGGDAGGWRILRDPLGINKLFWLRDPDGTIVVGARPRRFVESGYRFEEIRAVPSGAVVDLPPEGPARERSLVPAAWHEREGRSVEEIGATIRRSLRGYLAALLTDLRPSDVFVCLSGGLDSTGIAALAREVVPGSVAVSFDLKRPGGRPSDDRVAAERVARDLRMPMLDATVTEDELLDLVDTALVDGIDWRDFNVHAALVNAALARAIVGAGAGESAIVLTGDLANEFLVDYEPESYRGATYYRLPRLEPAALRLSLIRGLDTCHREVGIFSSFGLRLAQPYAVAADAYLAISEAFLHRQDRKPVLNGLIFGDLVPRHVYARKKVRAQVGSEEVGGVLAACLDRGLDQAWFRRRFRRIHHIDQDAELDRFIRAGRYRSGTPSLEGS